MCRSLGSWMKRQGKSRGTATEELQSVFAKESEILTKNIGSEPLRRNTIVHGHESLRMIAVLHESMVGSAMCVCVCVCVSVCVFSLCVERDEKVTCRNGLDVVTLFLKL